MGDVIYLESRRAPSVERVPRRQKPAPAWLVSVVATLVSLPLVVVGVAALSAYG